MQRGAQRDAVREVVDVFARAREVRELSQAGEALGVEAAAHQVLDGLHVVTGGGLEPGELVDLGLSEACGPLAQRRRLLGVDGRDPEHPAVREEQQPLDLDMDPGAVEARFREVLAERFDGGAVATVERAQRLRGKRTHGTPCRMAGSSCRNSEAHARSIATSTVSNMAASE